MLALQTHPKTAAEPQGKQAPTVRVALRRCLPKELQQALGPPGMAVLAYLLRLQLQFNGYALHPTAAGIAVATRLTLPEVRYQLRRLRDAGLQRYRHPSGARELRVVHADEERAPFPRRGPDAKLVPIRDLLCWNGEDLVLPAGTMTWAAQELARRGNHGGKRPGAGRPSRLPTPVERVLPTVEVAAMEDPNREDPAGIPQPNSSTPPYKKNSEETVREFSSLLRRESKADAMNSLRSEEGKAHPPALSVSGSVPALRLVPRPPRAPSGPVYGSPPVRLPPRPRPRPLPRLEAELPARRVIAPPTPEKRAALAPTVGSGSIGGFGAGGSLRLWIQELGRRLLPTLPSPQELPVPFLPSPKLLSPQMTPPERAQALATAYRGALVTRYPHLPNRSYAARGEITAHKDYALLCKAAGYCLEHDIAPSAWALWSMDVWANHMVGKGRVKGGAPRAVWVWSLVRLRKRLDWFRQDEGLYVGGIPLPCEEHKRLYATYLALWADLRRWMPKSRGEVMAIMDRYLPGDTWERMVRAAQDGNRAQQRAIDRLVARGEAWT